jgi:hypothetical protein
LIVRWIAAVSSVPQNTSAPVRLAPDVLVAARVICPLPCTLTAVVTRVVTPVGAAPTTMTGIPATTLPNWALDEVSTALPAAMAPSLTHLPSPRAP